MKLVKKQKDQEKLAKKSEKNFRIISRKIPEIKLQKI